MKKPVPHIIQTTIHNKLFSWDLAKEWEVVQERKITFAEAATIFADPYLFWLGNDRDYPSRNRVIGLSAAQRFLIVVHCDIFHDDLFCNEYRIITVFSPNPEERKQYRENMERKVNEEFK